MLENQIQKSVKSPKHVKHPLTLALVLGVIGAAGFLYYRSNSKKTERMIELDVESIWWI